MSVHIGRAASVLLGVIGACCLAASAALLAVWVLDGGGYRAAWPEGLGSLLLVGCGAALLLLGRALRRLAGQPGVAKPAPPA